MAAFGIALNYGGWGWTVTTLTTPGPNQPMRFAAEFLTIAPFLGALVASWLAFYPVERDFARTPNLVAYLVFQFRQQMVLALLPITVVICGQSIRRYYPQAADQTWFHLASVTGIVTVLILAPWVLRMVLGWRPLPAGPLRELLLLSARRLRFRFSDLMLWPTHGAVANAMVAGILPRPRYVLMTDKLISELTAEELEAVLGHEIGHVWHRHLILYALFIGLSLAVLTGLLQWADQVLPADAWLRVATSETGQWGLLATSAMVGMYLLFAFGFISRRCEREADLFGCRAVSCGRTDCDGHANQELVSTVTTRTPPCPTGIRIFIAALERVAVSNGISRNKPGWLSSWQHGSIARRVEFLERAINDPDVERRFRMQMRWFKLIVIGVLAALAVTLSLAGELEWPF
jgi:STE24 endopeptidase